MGNREFSIRRVQIEELGSPDGQLSPFGEKVRRQYVGVYKDDPVWQLDLEESSQTLLFPNLLRGVYPGAEVWVAEAPDGRIAGVQIAMLPEGRIYRVEELSTWEGWDSGLYLLTITISPEFQGRGLGRQMIAAIMDGCDEQLLAKTSARNERMINLLEKLGFVREEKEVIDSDSGDPNAEVTWVGFRRPAKH